VKRFDRIIDGAAKFRPIGRSKERVVVALAEVEGLHPGLDQLASRPGGLGVWVLLRRPVQGDQPAIVVKPFAEPLELDGEDEPAGKALHQA